MAGSIFQSWTAARIAHACGGEVRGDPDRRPAGIANDSRRLRRGELFVALRAERDGHQFVAAAREAGARLLLVERGHGLQPAPGEAIITVDDTFTALRELGHALWTAHQRVRTDRLALGITGSNGKTTTKELVASLLETVAPGQVLRTRGNLNNHIGLPMTLCELGEGHRFVVLEMGASVPGDIAMLVGVAPLDRALVTSVCAAHLEGLGDEASVALEKGAIFGGESPVSLAVMPHGHRGRLEGGTSRCRVLTFGAEAGADVQLIAYRPGSAATVTLRLSGTLNGGRALEVTLAHGLLGRHNALNLAAAVALTWDVLPPSRRIDRISEVAGAARPVAGRLTGLAVPGGAYLLDDSYNANPGSLAAALDVLFEKPGRRWLVLGDMLELGEAAAQAHRDAGRRATERGCERVWAVGQWAEEVAAGARAAGLEEVAVFEDAVSCAPAARAALAPGDVVLVKGSRGVGLDTVVAALSGGIG